MKPYSPAGASEAIQRLLLTYDTLIIGTLDDYLEPCVQVKGFCPDLLRNLADEVDAQVEDECELLDVNIDTKSEPDND